MKRIFAGLLLALVSIPAFAQSGVAVKQSGNITPNTVPWWLTSGVIGGGVTAVDSPISSFGATGPICSNSARQASGAWNSLCFQANTNSAATISLQNYGTAPPQSLVFVVNGVQYPIPVGSTTPTLFPNGVIGGGSLTDYYASPAGSDSNTCLSVSNPCLTLQGAWNKIAIANYGLGGATLHLADGTYSEGITVNQTWMGSGPISIVGNCSNPGNVIVTTATLPGAIDVQAAQVVNISCFEVRSTFEHGLYAKWGGVIRHSNMRFGTVPDGQQTVSFGGTIVIDGNYSIVGNATRHIYAHAGRIRSQDVPVTVTLVGTPAFTWFAFITQGSYFFYSTTYAGTGATGQKFLVTGNGQMEGSVASTAIPGVAAGQAFDGGYFFGTDTVLPVAQTVGIGPTFVTAAGVANTTAATATVQQWSGCILLEARGWSTASVASQISDWCIYNQTAASTPNTLGRLLFANQLNAGGWTDIMSLTPSGFLNVTGGYAINGADIRIPFSGTTNFFVATTGNDSNSCLTGNPCLTLQHAYNVIANNYDQHGGAAIINVADGTYTTPLQMNGTPTANNALSIIGNTGTPGNVILAGAGASTLTCNNMNVTLAGFEVRAAGGFSGLQANSGCDLSFSNLRFGAVTGGGDHMQATGGGRIHVTGSYAITGSAGYHWHSRVGGSIDTPSTPAITITLSGTPAFSNAFAGANFAQIYLWPSSTTFSGAATGPKFLTHNLARIESGGLGISGFPGDVAGTVSNAGQYDNLFAVGFVAAFSALPTCSAMLEGTMAPVSDSSTVTWGATITGGSTNHVGAYCDGTNWTVFSK